MVVQVNRNTADHPINLHIPPNIDLFFHSYLLIYYIQDIYNITLEYTERIEIVSKFPKYPMARQQTDDLNAFIHKKDILRRTKFYFCEMFANSAFIFRRPHVGQKCLL